MYIESADVFTEVVDVNIDYHNLASCAEAHFLELWSPGSCCDILKSVQSCLRKQTIKSLALDSNTCLLTPFTSIERNPEIWPQLGYEESGSPSWELLTDVESNVLFMLQSELLFLNRI